MALAMLLGANWLEPRAARCRSTLASLFPEGWQPNIIHRGRYFEHLQHMVSAGLGVTIWPEHAPHLDTVVTRPIEGDRMRRKIQLRIVQGRQSPPHSRHL